MKRWWKSLDAKNPFRAVYPKEAKAWKLWLAKMYVPLSAFFYPFSGINRAYRKFLRHEGPAVFARALESLQISFDIRRGELEAIPPTGPLLLISNHPTGAIDGVLLARLLEMRKREFRIMVMADTGLETLAELAPFVLPVDLRDNAKDPIKNLRAVRNSLEWLRDGNCLIIFPAGGLPVKNKETGQVQEPEWKNNVIKYLQKAKAPIFPVYLQMQSSKFYQWMGERNESFRVGLLGEQIVRLKRKSVPLILGDLISTEEIEQKAEDGLESLKKHLRASVFKLASEVEDTSSQPLKPFS